jgi:superfamily I DNA and RNA helicase
VKLDEIFSNNDGLRQDFIKLVDILRSKKSIFYAQDILKNLNNHGYIDSFID